MLTAQILNPSRSGSSFLGQIFNQHPDVFYHFEPLLPFGRNCNLTAPAFKKEKINVLEDILKCDMPNWRHLINKMPPRPLQPTELICIYTGACFRVNSKGKMCNTLVMGSGKEALKLENPKIRLP